MSAIRRLGGRDDEFSDGSTAFLVTKDLDLATLEQEITEAHGWRNPAGLVTEASDEGTVLWVLRPDADVRTVKATVTAHQGVEDVEPDDLARLRAKASAGEDLTADEMQTALRLLLRGT